MINKKTEKQTWWIAYDNGETFHYGSIQENQQISTGQPFLELFHNKVEWEKRLLAILPPHKYNEFVESKESDEQILLASNRKSLDHFLYTDSVDHLLYENRGFRLSENLNR